MVGKLRRQKMKCSHCSPDEAQILFVHGACELSKNVGKVNKKERDSDYQNCALKVGHVR